VARVAIARGSRVDHASARCEYEVELSGSAKKGTARSDVREFRTHLRIDSPEPDDEIAEIVRLAKATCHAEVMIQTAVPLRSRYTINGRELSLEQAASVTPRPGHRRARA
jgi:hypothetical protein